MRIVPAKVREVTVQSPISSILAVVMLASLTALFFSSTRVAGVIGTIVTFAIFGIRGYKKGDTENVAGLDDPQRKDDDLIH